MGRVSTFEANDLAGLIGWYRAEMGPVYESGAAKALQWFDRSGSGNHLLQATSGSRPILASGPPGRPVLLFDGVDDWMQMIVTLPQPVTLVLLYKSLVTGAPASHNYIADGGGQNKMVVVSDTAPNYSLYAGATLAYVGAVAAGVFACSSHVFNGASSLIRVNGVQTASGNAGATAPAGLALGSTGAGTAANSSNIAVAEAALYSRVLATSELVQLERSLGQRYSVGVA